MKALLIGLWVLLLCSALTIGAVTTQARTPDGLPSPFESPAATGQERTSFKAAGFQAPTGAGIIYLPLISRAAVPGISGRVTYQGAPAMGVDLSLRFYNGSAFSTAATIATDLDGRYVFHDPSGLLAGQRYYVRFGPNDQNCQSPFGWCGPGYLSLWHGPLITSYAAGNAAAGGDFDIANVSLLSPAAGPPVSVSLPVQFTWLPRGFGNEGYRWMLYDPSSTTSSWTSGDLGDVGAYTLSALPGGVIPGKVYRWYVAVYTGPDSYGTSYFYREVIFPQTAAAKTQGERLQPIGMEREERSGVPQVREKPQP